MFGFIFLILAPKQGDISTKTQVFTKSDGNRENIAEKMDNERTIIKINRRLAIEIAIIFLKIVVDRNARSSEKELT